MLHYRKHGLVKKERIQPPVWLENESFGIQVNRPLSRLILDSRSEPHDLFLATSDVADGISAEFSADVSIVFDDVVVVDPSKDSSETFFETLPISPETSEFCVVLGLKFINFPLSTDGKRPCWAALTLGLSATLTPGLPPSTVAPRLPCEGDCGVGHSHW
jgi:hypothetical protein